MRAVRMSSRTRSWFGAGVVLVASLFLLAACSSTPEQTLDLSGSWSGTWSQSGVVQGAVSTTFVQAGNALSGNVMITNSPCVTDGTITGTVTQSGASFGAVVGPDEITFTATTVSESEMSGTWEVGAGACSGGEGTFSLEKFG